MRPDDLQERALATNTAWPLLVFGGSFNKGDICAVHCAGDWAPIAVGRFAMSSEDMVYCGERGVAVDVLHHMDDSLWTMGSGRLPPADPPASLAAAAELHEQELQQEAEDQLRAMELNRQKQVWLS